mgnify:FL=1
MIVFCVCPNLINFNTKKVRLKPDLEWALEWEAGISIPKRCD